MSSRRPIGSVLIPAHDEGAVIGRAYIALGGSARSKRDESSPRDRRRTRRPNGFLMCGICGIWNFSDPAAGRERIDRMLDTIVHRGPDGGGLLDRPGLALGMRRLAIIDLVGGDQPIFNEDGSVAVVFNGEIYNFRELRAELERGGHRFATRSDTEVLVHGYEQWGDDMLHRLVGMFAFALWDENRRRLLVARDRFGKKPLYYSSHRGGEIVFGSEIKALLAAGVPADLDDAALEDYLALRYVPAPRTLFRSVRQLPAGHKMVIGEDQFEVQRWWRLRYEPKPAVRLAQAADDVEDLMRTAVERRLVSDVPLGCFLSGGLDSSTVLSFMSELSDEPVRTFSIGFDEGWASDELPPPARQRRPSVRGITRSASAPTSSYD